MRWHEDGFVQLGRTLIGMGMTGRPGEQFNMSISVLIGCTLGYKTRSFAMQMKVLEMVGQCVVGVFEEMASREIGRDGNCYGHKSSGYGKHVTSDGNYGKGVERVNQSHVKEAESYMNAGRNSGNK